MKQKKNTRKIKIEQAKHGRIRSAKPVSQHIPEPQPAPMPDVPEGYDVFTSPESSNVEGGTFYGDTGELVLAFRDKKKIGAEVVFYAYSNVDPRDWEGLKTADSKGRYMNDVIKKKYKGQQVPS